jgi:hypothetical protein
MKTNLRKTAVFFQIVSIRSQLIQNELHWSITFPGTGLHACSEDGAYNIHTQFRENRSDVSKVEREKHAHTHTRARVISLSHLIIIFSFSARKGIKLK